MMGDVNLKGVPETLLVPLFYRAKETQSPVPLIKDQKAVEIVGNIDYDFSRCNKWMTQSCVVVRTRLFQDAIAAFLRQHPESVVINLAAGLDNRFEELDNGKVYWFDLDLPEVIDIRKRYFEETERRKFIACDVLDFRWMDKLEAEHKNKPVLIVAEGLLPYLPEERVRDLMAELSTHLPQSQILFEIFGSFVIGREWMVPEFKHIKPVPRFFWSPRDATSIAGWDPRFAIKTVDNLFDHYQDQWRAMRHLFKIAPALKDLLGSRVVLIDLNNKG